MILVLSTMYLKYVISVAPNSQKSFVILSTLGDVLGKSCADATNEQNKKANSKYLMTESICTPSPEVDQKEKNTWAEAYPIPDKGQSLPTQENDTLQTHAYKRGGFFPFLVL